MSSLAPERVVEGTGTTDAPSARRADPSETLSFVCCVEAGGLEEQTVRMVESLRRWGGRYANCPVLAFTPRLGAPLSRRTREAFDALDVGYYRRNTSRRSWFKFLNKPYALLAAEAEVRTEQVCWIDSDVLFLSEPSELVLGPEEDFAACASDRNIGTTGDDEFAAYWRRVTTLFSLSLDEMPLVRTHEEQADIRFYFNSGVFVYRAHSGFAERYLEGCTRLLDSKIASRHSGIFFTDQVCLGLVALAMRLRWRTLPLSHNYPLGSKRERAYDREKLRECAVCHYHDALWPHFFPKFVSWVDADFAPISAWLREQGPLQNRTRLPWKVVSRALSELREWQTRRFERDCERT